MRDKVPAVWPWIRSVCPGVKTLNLTRITPCSQRGNMCHGKNRRSLEIRQYYFSSCCHLSITCTFIKMRKEDVIYHYLKGTPPPRLPMQRAFPAGNPLTDAKVGLFIGSHACSCHCISWEKIYWHALIHLWLLLIICPNDLSIKRKPSG